MLEGIDIAVRDEDGRAVLVTVSGDVDIANVDQFRTAISGVPAGRELVIDLNEVGYLDSAGVAVLFERAREGRLEVVAGPDCVVRRVLEVVALDQMATVSYERPST